MIRRRTAGVVGAVALLALTGCSQLEAGAAAEVGSTTISNETVDEFASGLCAYTLAGGSAVGTIDTKRSALGALIYAELATSVGEQEGIEPEAAYVDQNLDQIGAALESLSPAERESFLGDARVVLEGESITQQALAMRATLQSIELTPENTPAVQGEMVTEWAADQGVEIDPRFGSWNGSQIVAESGSLSVPETQEEIDPANPTAGLPAFLTCR